MTSSSYDDVAILTSDSERAPSITYIGIIIAELFNTCPIHLGSKQRWQCIRTSSTNDKVTMRTSDSERAPSITYIGIIRSQLLTLALYIKGQKNIGNVL